MKKRSSEKFSDDLSLSKICSMNLSDSRIRPTPATQIFKN
ncbi:hypothetical protein NEIELOOT_00877 [Neisseria elongata subsp. glycolytica ATCC 29315]|uniref:Uncharacterized protein n=1 Tax=Neisseria elongata subsp. glycolytica ATCC 29315 TaxID=546263 RepID=D4DP92_NEIEG|nr:hypothetical protein NEIELOOT_00877 [Neisseria elongata subsp. glycolytica ATCC 29315]